MANLPARGHEALRAGRWSAAGAEYFLTCCTEDRQRGLDSAEVTTAVLTIAKGLCEQHVWRLRTATVMRDHVHLLVTLGENIELTGAVRLFKGRMAPVLRKAKLRWQRAYFDHRLRIDEDRMPVFSYIFLNSYRGGLVQVNEKWPGYFRAEEDWAWFGPITNEACPFPEWLK